MFLSQRMSTKEVDPMSAHAIRGRIGIGAVKGDSFLYFIFIPEDGSVHAVAHTNLCGLAKALLNGGARTLYVTTEREIPCSCTAYMCERGEDMVLVESIEPACSWQESFFLEEVKNCVDTPQ